MKMLGIGAKKKRKRNEKNDFKHEVMKICTISFWQYIYCT